MDYEPRIVDLYDEDNPDGPDHDFYRALAVLPSEVVNALRWSLTSDPGVGSVMIVMVQPGVIGFSPGRFTVVGSGVGPFLGQGSVKPFDFPVGLGAIGASEPMFHARPQRGIEQA